MTAVQSIDAAYGQRKRRGDAHNPTDPVRKNSFDVGDCRAQPHRRIGTGTLPFGKAFKAAMIDTAKWLYKQQRREGYYGPDRLQRAHLLMFEGLLGHLDYATGRLDPSWATIQESGDCGRSTVDRGLDALYHAGFVCVVRRTRRRDGAEGQRGPQLAQTSSAIYFDCKARMAPATFATFWAHLLKELAKGGQWLKSRARAILETFNSEAVPSPRESRVPRIMKRVRATVKAEAAEPVAQRAPVAPTPARPASVNVVPLRPRDTTSLGGIQEAFARMADRFGIDPGSLFPNAGT